MINKKEIMTKAKEQCLHRSDMKCDHRNGISGLDVAVWLGRHIGFFALLIPVIIFVSTVVWKVYMKPEVLDVAKKLDAPIILQAKENKKLSKKTYYIVKKMELVQQRTAPKKIVRDAAEEIEIEKLNDK